MPPQFRYEFYLPILYNNKEPIEKSKFRYIKNLMLKEFKGVSTHPGFISGGWVNPDSNKLYTDELIRFEVCIDGSITNQLYFEKLKTELKDLFKQHEIYMVYTEVTKV